ncbi:MAG: tripartite tricarboxylate transporter substrate binding protein, partial [Clostridia bacterium]|nr:tripartite tricarboxylate transporter substrate binding protein [Clostridia bacterium]
MKTVRLLVLCVMFFSFCMTLNLAVAADFPEKDITIIIPAKPGGGYDAYAKALQPYLQKYLPQNVNIIIKYMPGAGMTRAATAVYQAKPDGYTIGYFSIPGMVINQLLGNTEYDLKKITWIGRNDQTPYVLAAAKSAPFSTIEEMQKSKEQVVFGSESIGTTTYVMCTVIPEIFKIPYRQVTGYSGSREVIVAVMRGDAQVTTFPVTSLNKFFESGDLKPIFILDTERSKLIPNTPTTVELGKPNLASLKLNRMIGGPPGIPQDRVKILEEALIKAENDPELMKWSRKTEHYYHPMTGAETKKLVVNIFDEIG